MANSKWQTKQTWANNKCEKQFGYQRLIVTKNVIIVQL
jgi:hypothetical protein